MRFQLNVIYFLRQNGQMSVSPPTITAALCNERESPGERGKRVNGESIIPGDFKSFASGKCDFTKACFEKDWRLWAIFSFCIPRLLFLSFAPLPLFFTSIHPLLRRAPLTAETPLCTQVLPGLHGSPQKLCVCWSVFEWEQKRWYDLPWQTGFVIQYFKLYSLSTNLPEPLTHNCAWSNGGYSSGSWLQLVSESFKNCLWAKQH